MQDCEKYDIMLNARLDGTLNKKDAKELDRHLAACADCRNYLQLLELMREGLREDLPDPPDSLREGIMYKLGLEKNRKLRFGAFGRWTAIAAVLCVVILGAVKLNGSGVMQRAAPEAAAAPGSSTVEYANGGASAEAGPEEEQFDGLLESKQAVPEPTAAYTARWEASAPAAGSGSAVKDRGNADPGAAADDSVYAAGSLPGYDRARAALDSGRYWGVCLFYEALPERTDTGAWESRPPEEGENARWLLTAEQLQALETGAEWNEFYYGDLTADRGLVIVIAGEEE